VARFTDGFSSSDRWARFRRQRQQVQQIHDESSHAARLALHLRTRFGVDDAVVVAASIDPAQAKAHVGMAAARRLRPHLRDGLRIGISWGTTLYELVRQVEPLALRGVEVLQLHGGLCAGDPAIDGFGLAQKLAEKLQGSYRIVQAPIIVPGCGPEAPSPEGARYRPGAL
jgi:deoxyribonucleoside regulator